MRIIRILTYEGEENRIRQTLEHSAVPNNGSAIFGGLLIESETLIKSLVVSSEPCDHCYGLQPKTPWLTFCPACGRKL